MKTLYLVRHAKSSWDDITLADSDRPLNKRGLNNAPDMGQRLARKGIQLDQIISSPALRALTTAQLIAQQIDYDPQAIEHNQRLYFEGIPAMMDIIHRLERGQTSVMIVGHNPDITRLLNRLCGFQVSDMPTCAIATIGFSLDNDWLDVAFGSGKLIDYDYPKKPKPSGLDGTG
ncbi:MAG: phosphohistidine phosphatase SixA [Gammaproteobacteria bacterium]|nr:phosphohistidine phosphatase SixA [Gammaproteobacteria bacterium]